MRGSVFKTRTGYRFAIRVDVTPYEYVDRNGQRVTADQRQLKRAGFERSKDAKAALDHVNQLIALGADDDRLRRKIGDMVCAARYGRPLPSVDEVRRRLGAHRDPDARTYSVGEWLDVWLAQCEHLQPSTYGDHTTIVRLYLKPHLGDVMLDRLDDRHLGELFAWINARNDVVRQARDNGDPVPSNPLDDRKTIRQVGAAMQRKILKTLCVALNAAKKRRLIDYNPATEYKLPRVRSARAPRPRVWWSSDQVRRFLDATRDDRLHALWRVALLRGLRRGELLALRWSDVDLDHGMLFVRSGKTESSKRTVSLDAGTVAVLREHGLRQKKERLATVGAYQENNLVFAQEDGSPIPEHRITFGFQKLARRHGLPRMRFHDARHTAASIALESGIDIKIVSDQLGHSTTRLTHDLYSHVVRRLHDEAAETVAALVDGA
ncbi:MAG TPA: site-specific integrase [Jiangellaceae bacterium]|nr:site-specific integrase [Jiangellaceae bacterium]